MNLLAEFIGGKLTEKYETRVLQMLVRVSGGCVGVVPYQVAQKKPINMQVLTIKHMTRTWSCIHQLCSIQ